MQAIAAIDFDGTLVTHEWPNIGKPIPEVVTFVKDLQSRGWKLILWTCRTGSKLREAVKYCNKVLNLRFDAVNNNLPETIRSYGDCRKVNADLYIDDRAINSYVLLKTDRLTSCVSCEQPLPDNEGVICNRL